MLLEVPKSRSICIRVSDARRCTAVARDVSCGSTAITCLNTRGIESSGY